MKNKIGIVLILVDCLIVATFAFLFLHSQSLHSDITKIDKTTFYNYTLMEDSYYEVDQQKVQHDIVSYLADGKLEEAQKLNTLLSLCNLQIEKISENRVSFFCPEATLTFRRCSALLTQ